MRDTLKLALEFLDTLSELHLLWHDGERVRAVIKQALTAPVQPVVEYRGVSNDGHYIIKPMQPLKSGALFYTTPPAQPAQPASVPDVAWLAQVIRSVNGEDTLGAGALAEAIVTAMLVSPPTPQRQWVGLTDEEVAEGLCKAFWEDAARAIEAKLKEKNT